MYWIKEENTKCKRNNSLKLCLLTDVLLTPFAFKTHTKEQTITEKTIASIMLKFHPLSRYHNLRNNVTIRPLAAYWHPFPYIKVLSIYFLNSCP